jgi:hypothetical protein
MTPGEVPDGGLVLRTDRAPSLAILNSANSLLDVE